jgi:hypothetical protein
MNNITQSINTNNYNKVLMNKLHTNETKDLSKLIQNIKTPDYAYRSPNFNDYKVFKINIDSRFRKKIPMHILDNNIFTLPKDPLKFTRNSSVVTINCPNHGITLQDKIILKNVVGESYFDNIKLTFYKESTYVKIELDTVIHNLYVSDKVSIDLFVTFSGISGITSTNNFLNNIPINLLNKTHKIYLIKSTTEVPDISRKYFYIQIPIAAELTNPTFIVSSSGVGFIFQNIANIHINEINVDFPITFNNSRGQHSITEIIDTNNLKITLNKDCSRDITATGGSNVTLIKIMSTSQAYPDANNYKIDLGINLSNIEYINLISTEIPNSDKIIRDYPESRRNNKVYWQIAEDGDIIYSIDITPGNYGANCLAEEIGIQWNKTIRTLRTTTSTSSTKSNLNRVNVYIDTLTNIVTFKAFSVYILSLALTRSKSEFLDGLKRVIIVHPNHGLSPGDAITIEGALSTDTIPRASLNAEHIIESLVDANSYVIKIPSHNSNSSEVTYGGSSISVLTPVKFRLLFDRHGTVGNILGFRNVKTKTAITPYATSISNNMAYEQDYFINEVGLQIGNDSYTQVTNNILQLYGDNYIILTCDAIQDDVKLGKLDGQLAKLFLSHPPGSVIYNSFVQINHYIKKEKTNISELEFSFSYPDGTMYDFNGLDHSFTLEILTRLNQVKNSNINSKMTPI